MCGVYGYYRPQRSCGKIIFSQASVILVTEGVSGRHPPGQTPPRADAPRGYCSGRTVLILLECILVNCIITNLGVFEALGNSSCDLSCYIFHHVGERASEDLLIKNNYNARKVCEDVVFISIYISSSKHLFTDFFSSVFLNLFQHYNYFI